MWLTNALIVDAERMHMGSVRVEDGIIAEVSDVKKSGLDCGGAMLTPGLVDMHGDMIEQELEPRPQVHFPTDVALNALDHRLASSGITTAYASVSFSAGASKGQRRSFEHTSDVIRAIHASRPRLRIDHKIHARFDITFDDALDVVRGLIKDGTVDLISLMDHTPGQGQYRDLERFTAQVAYSRGVNVSEAQDLVAAKIAERSRPADVIADTLRQIADLCQAANVAIASHDDDTPEKVALMAGLGAAISEFPVTLDAARAAKTHGLAIAMGAPNALRGKSYSGNLSARDAHGDGLLDILAADYHPGALFPAVLSLGKSDPKGLQGAVAMVTDHPASALGLTDRGTITPGARADLAVFDQHASGRCLLALSRGRLVHSDGTIDQ